MREGTPRNRALPLRALGLCLPLAAIVAASYLGGLTDAHAAQSGPAVTFAGATSQHSGSYGTQRLPSSGVAFSYAGGRVSDFSIPWVARCLDTQGGASAPLLDRFEILATLTVKHGSFAEDGVYTFRPGRSQKAAVSLTLRGTVRGPQASGTLDVSAEVAWDPHHARFLSLSNNVARCNTTKVIHWSAAASGAPGNFAFPLLARRQSAAQPLAVVEFARTGTTTGTSSIFNTWRHGPPSWRLTHPPPGASDSHPTIALHRPLLAFQRATGGTTQIFAKAVGLGVNVDGLPAPGFNALAGATMQLTSFPTGADDPAVSPDGQAIAFSVGTGADCAIWLMDQAGHAQRQLTNQTPSLGCDDQPAWSPDGASIAFRRTQMDASGRQVVTYMTVPATGGAPQTLNLPASVSGLSWAPGDKLVFVSSGGANKPPSLHIANPDGSGERTVLRARGLTGRPAWSPDRETIAFTLRDSNGTTDIATVSARGGRVTDITDTSRASESDPVWEVPLTVTSPETPTRSIPVKSSPTRRRRR
jgi:hypothetical protein